MINLYTNSTIGSYTTGTVTCTKNSSTVTGTGTTWSEIVNPGDILTLNDDKLYVIQSVNSNTSLTLDKPFAETTVSNSNYRIFLNTAAHFPSDTAAKVERALEQLSDINEAAINNNRTVTAATKVNGKGITSTIGDLQMNPPTVNSNTGGQINFHYNQNANTTSSIVENASGQIRVNGDLYLNGNTTNGLKVKGGSLEVYTNTDSSVNQVRDIIVYGPDANRISTLRNSLSVSGNKELEIFVLQNVDGSSVFNSLRMTNDTEGNRRCFLNYSPATNSNSTDIATTAYTRAYTSATYLPLAGGTLTGNLVLNGQLKQGRLVFNNLPTRGVAPSSQVSGEIFLICDNAGIGWGNNLASVTSSVNTSNTVTVGLNARSNTSTITQGTISVSVDGNNKVYTAAPTPATTDNSTKIATTAFVNNLLSSFGSLVVEGYNNLEVPTGTVTNAQILTLSTGLYIIQLTTFWESNSSGYRQLGLATNQNGQNLDRYTVYRAYPLNSTTASAYSQFTFLFNVTAASATYYYNLLQTSGSTLTANGGYKYLRVR